MAAVIMFLDQIGWLPVIKGLIYFRVGYAVFRMIFG
jgi:hypothetical protein